MAITGSISLNSVHLLSTTPLSFQIWVNVAIISTEPLTQMDLYYDNVLKNTLAIPTTPVPKYSYGSTAVPYLLPVGADTEGWHDIGIKYTNSVGETETFNLSIHLDVDSPIIHKFEKTRLYKNAAQDFVVEWDIELEDNSGISKIILQRQGDSSNDVEVNVPIGMQHYNEKIPIVVPKTIPNNSTQQFFIDVYDYSDNHIRSSLEPVFFTTSSPVITSFVKNYISQTATDYEIDVTLHCTFSTAQNITGFSCKFEDPNPTWRTYMASGGTATINAKVLVPKTTSAGLGYKLYAQLIDNYYNKSPIEIIEFDLDKLAPQGSLKMNYAKKVGTYPNQFYHANLHFHATDSGSVTHYAFSDIGPSHLTTWTPITPTTVFDLYQTYNIGQSGSKTVYAKYRDSSGNESDVFAEAMSIDDSPPSVSFDFAYGEKRGDGDYNAYFDLTAIDSDAIKFIKFYGVNSNTNNLISGHSNTWATASGSTHIIERRAIIIPASEYEDRMEFHFQARDIYGNESTKPMINVHFDTTQPIVNSFVYDDTTHFSTEYRIHTTVNAIDNKGIVAYRFGFDNITIQPWIYTTKTNHFTKELSLDVPIPSELGVQKQFYVQVKDEFGNESVANSLPVKINNIPPEKTPGTNGLEFAGGALTSDGLNYEMTFKIDARDVDPTDNVYFYSLEVDDVATKNWKILPTPNNTISELVTIKLPRSSTGNHDFYLRFADIYKNESPVYNAQYDLDAISTVGGLTLNSISKGISTYTANVKLFAVDNRKIQSYFIQDSESGPEVEVAIVPPVQVFNDHYEFNIGSTAGPKWATVRFKDTFDNMSETYRIDFDLDTEKPNFNYYFAGATSNATHMFLDFDLDFTDNYQLRYYKFWDSTVLEPDWTEIPRANNVSVSKTVTLPKGTTNPTFTWKVLDFFGNSNTASFNKFITSVAPTTTLTLNAISYTVGDVKVKVDYDILAASGSQVDKFDVDINSGLDNFSTNLFPNKTNPKGQIEYSFPLHTTQADIKVTAYSDYGYVDPSPPTFTTFFDSIVPNVSNVAFLGSYGLGGNYVLQFRIITSDDVGGSGIRRIIFHDPSSQMADVIQTTPLTPTIDQIINVTVPGTYPVNTISPTLYVEDLMGNRSSGNTVPSIYLDNAGAAVANVVINSNTRYPSLVHTSPGVGANTNIIPVEFKAQDYSEITHYHYSPNAIESFNSATWKQLATPTKNLVVSETINLDSLGFVEGHGGFYIHTIDRFGNQSAAGEVFEYDKTKPNLTINFQNRIERANVAGIDHFVIPYTFTYSDTHAEIVKKRENHRIGGVWSSANNSILPFEMMSSATTEKYYLPVSNYGDTRINVSIFDRLNNQSANSNFDVWLEDNPPVINYGIINGGAPYTTNKNVLVRIDMLDDRGVTDYLISNTANLVWDSPGWATIPLSPATAITSTFSVDLEALGFDQGTCNVHMYIKDFCQNVSNTVATIIYDYEPPEVVHFKIDSFTRTPTTFDITLNAHAYDVTSGLDTYYISQSSTETVYNPVPGTPPPIINDGSAPTEFKKIEQVSVRDSGWKYFYFSATDAAGNVSEKANTKMYIDSIAPVGVTFESASPVNKYYLSNTQTNFNYTVTDDYALAVLGFNFDSGITTGFRTYPPPVGFGLGTTSDSGTFSATTMTSLTEGIHTINLVVKDTFNNTVEVPYEFYFDQSPPEINVFELKRIRPDVDPPPSSDFWVEMNLDITDAAGIDYYEIWDNGVLKATVNVDDKHVAQTPTIKTSLAALMGPSGLDIQLVMLEDIFGVKQTEVFALVDGYASAADNAKIIKIVSAIASVPQHELSISIRSETDINTLNRGSAGPQTLDAAVPDLVVSDFMTAGSYTLIELESRANPSSDSRLVRYMKTDPINTFYEDANTAELSVNQYTGISISPIYPDASVVREVHEYELRAFDYAGNVSIKTFVEAFHDGTSFAISDFYVDGTTSITRTAFTSEVFTAQIDSLVDVEEFAITIHDDVDYYSMFWEPISTPQKNVSWTRTRDSSEYALTNVGPTNRVHLHAKDRNGHMISSDVEFNVTTSSPTITSVASPITLKRQGNYYIGTLNFDIDDSNYIEAYAMGYSKDPTNYKSIPLTMSGTITQEFKIDANSIDGNAMLYLKLRDVDGNESSNYRIALRVIDFKLEEFDVETNEFLTGMTNNIDVVFDTDTDPFTMEYGYKIDDSTDPISWTPISPFSRDDVGKFTFTFNLDVSTISNGHHELYVWLKTLEGEKKFHKVEFMSEKIGANPYGSISVKKSLIENGKKKVWIEANVFDDGVGVKAISLDESINPVSFENINIIQNKRITKLFEYDTSANTVNTYSLMIEDAIGRTAGPFNLSVDLNHVY
ncbi:MAG: hypothetical protein VW270_00290 [Candidatus Poseidoniales archaeon]